MQYINFDMDNIVRHMENKNTTLYKKRGHFKNMYDHNHVMIKRGKEGSEVKDNIS